MVTRMRHIVTRMLVCACFMLYGCTNDDALCDKEVPDGIVQVGFRIRLSDEYGAPASGTRADGTTLPPDYDDPEKYETGAGYENYIGLADDDFFFLLFDEDGRYVETMDVLGVVPVGGGEYSTEYTVLCTLTKRPEGTFKVVALANWGVGNYPRGADLAAGVTTIRDVCSSAGKNNVYAYKAPFAPSARTPIPMYGIKTSSISLETGRYNDIGDLYLLRAMAKVEVICEKNSGLELATVTLSGYNDRGFCAPDGMDANTAYVSGTHIPDNAVTEGSAPLDFRISENKDRAVLYIPEYRNTGTDPRCRLSVTFADNPDRTFTIDFCEYRNGVSTNEWFDILRNCCYHFTVDKTPEFEVDVIPYGEKWLDPVFGL